MLVQPLPRRRSLAQRIVLGALVLVGLLVLAEVGLRVAGVGDPWERFERRAGLSDTVRYLSPDELVAGGWRTQMYGDAAREVQVPARDARARVLLLGGSTVSGLEAKVLAAALDAAQPGRGHEVINLGRPGYGAERVLILLRQALATLHPDVVVVSVGQQEFFEPGLGAALAEGKGLSPLDELRCAGLVASLWEPRLDRVPWEGDGEPEPLGSWVGRMAGFTPAGRDCIYEAFGRLLDSIVALTHRAGARLVLCTSASNLLVPPSTPDHQQPLPPALRAQFDAARERVHAALPERFVAGLIRTAPDKPPLILGFRWWGEELRSARVQTGPPPSQGVAALPLRALAAPFDGGAQWSDPDYWDPRVHQLVGTLHDFHERKLTPEERAAVEEAKAAAEEAVSISPGHAYAVFELGLAQYLLGEDEAAVGRLREAQLLDLHPNRGNDRTNALVREAAARAPDVVLADLEALLRDASPNGLVGYELMADASLLQPGARKAELAALVPAILRP
ncbi:MAG TPA: hypothetical protein VFY71_17135 [Planctomycetota bacterium]|nr:hypothetical protein [Planctomycetota bacterium]